MSFDLKILERDLAISSDGDLQKVENTEKLTQDLLKIAITPIGANPFYKAYGCMISKSLIGNVLDKEFVTTVASNQLRNSLEILQKLQKVQSSYQVVTPSELLFAIKESKIEQNLTDPRFFNIIISALTKALTSVNTSFEIKSF